MITLIASKANPELLKALADILTNDKPVTVSLNGFVIENLQLESSNYSTGGELQVFLSESEGD